MDPFNSSFDIMIYLYIRFYYIAKLVYKILKVKFFCFVTKNIVIKLKIQSTNTLNYKILRALHKNTFPKIIFFTYNRH